MKRMLFIFPACFLLILLGCASGDFSAESKLQNLRSSLELVKNAPVDKPFAITDTPRQDVSFLVGQSRSQIKSSLGTPNVCGTVMPAPCEHQGDWFYSFYKLPTGWLGGGPELFLTFGKDDICSSAKWVFTQ
jgi:hypothetical protein